MPRLLIVEDDDGMRMRLRQLLTEQLPGVQVRDVNSLAKARQKLSSEHWDLVMLDVRLKRHNGLDLLPALRNHRPNLPVIVLSSLPEVPYARAAMNAGASAYLAKERCLTELAPLIGRLLAMSA